MGRGASSNDMGRSPSPPPAVPLPQDQGKNRPSQGDAVLVSFMDGGKRPDIARTAGREPLQSDDESSDSSVKGTEITVGKDKQLEKEEVQQVDMEPEKHVSRPEVDLTALAAGALQAAREANAHESIAGDEVSATGHASTSISQIEPGDPMEVDRTPTVPSIKAHYHGDFQKQPSSDAQDAPVKTETSPPSGTGELPPIQKLSPQSGLVNGAGTGPITLPSLSDQLGDLNHLGQPATSSDPSFAPSPQVRPPPRFQAVPGQSSPPPRSPNEFRRELPSPGRVPVGPVGSYYTNTNFRRPSQSDGPGYASAADYSSSNTETPSTDQSASTPATIIDRMSIDGIQNPQIGGFQCIYPGCTAQPFQTQVSRLTA